MPTYVTIRYAVSNPDAYARYRELAGPTVAQYDGTFVAKGVMEHLEGSDVATNFALIEFPSAEAAKTWFESDGYRLARDARAGAGDMAVAILS